MQFFSRAETGGFINMTIISRLRKLRGLNVMLLVKIYICASAWTKVDSLVYGILERIKRIWSELWFDVEDMFLWNLQTLHDLNAIKKPALTYEVGKVSSHPNCSTNLKRRWNFGVFFFTFCHEWIRFHWGLKLQLTNLGEKTFKVLARRHQFKIDCIDILCCIMMWALIFCNLYTERRSELWRNADKKDRSYPSWHSLNKVKSFRREFCIEK